MQLFMQYAPSQVRKTMLAVLGFAAVMLSTVLAVGPDLIPDRYLPWVNVVIALATTYGVFRVPNSPADGEPADPDISETGHSTVDVVALVLLVLLAVWVVVALLAPALAH